MIPCPLKKLTGFDCPGCGFQRSLIALLKGDVINSFYLYPATLPILVFLALCVTDARYKYDKNLRIKRPLFIFTAAVIAIAYVIKMSKYNPLA
ncbi:DUF2752 domain-containing protein [Mucilaginibacter gracilis]|nr:DUF2752 domain-containing protein [Mucilaginibacter gracilis]